MATSRSDSSMLTETLTLLEHIARSGGYVASFPTETDDVSRVLMLARSIAHRWRDDDAPTAKLPPVRESLGPRRRPPAPVVRELTERVELLRALVEELGDYDDDAGPPGTPDPVCGCIRPGYCRAYGSSGCAMKAEERP